MIDGLSTRTIFGFGLFLLAITLGVVLFVLPIMVQEYRDLRTLQDRGIEGTAQAQRVWSTPGGARSGPAYHMDLTFAGPDGRQVSDEIYISSGEAEAVRAPSPVPIMYDPQDPSVVRLNLDDSVRRAHPLRETIGWMGMLAAIFAILWAGQAALLVGWLRKYREARGSAGGQG